MEWKEIQRLMDAMGESKLTELTIDFADGTKIGMKKAANAVTTEVTSMPVMPVTQTISQVVPMAKDANQAEVMPSQEEKKDNQKVIKAPMVGTFYSKASPNAEAFVKEGDKVEKGQTLCIVEAMKLMNEIESDYAGTVKKVLVKDGEMVEYGQALFELE